MKNILMLVTAITLLNSAAVSAQEVNVQALQACRMIENDFNRLVCYDAVMGGKPLQATQQLARPTATAAQVVTDSKAPEADTVNPDNNRFGLEHRKTQAEEAQQDLVATLSKLNKNAVGERSFVLDNGQVWKQLGSDSFLAREGDEVVISRGVLNSFLMKVADTNRTIRVKRVK
ncbi:hypothetical protein ACFOEE_17400 [Pseudoalteromonas fenneropenaei]|uniref:Uncharacterized protein n=1 Tax=Pseudoalteromonas fenneropenaei TaxID=1737459 RepID=A0ABV7CNN0_9GAMM